MLLLAAPVALELELAGGVALPSADAPQDGPAGPALQARAGADFFEHVTISAVLLGVVGEQTAASFCGGGGGACRGFVSRQVALGLELAWTKWTNVSRPAFTYGATNLPARSDLSVDAIMLAFLVSWSTGR